MQNTNRLNFSNMVGNQLNSNNRGRQADVYFQPLYAAARKPNMNSKAHKRIMPKTKIDTSLKSIINTVHTTMKDKSIIPPKSTGPSIPQPIKEIDKANFTKIKNKKNVVISRHSLPTANRSIPQTKANWEQKSHQRMRRGIGNTCGVNTNNFGYQQRVKEVLRQKRILEDMLNEHQRLQRDRVSIAVEIQAMKNYLNDIRDKLDFSLRKLSVKKPIGAAPTTKSPPKARQTSARSVSRSGNANNNKKAQMKNTPSASPKKVEVKKKHKV